MKYPEWITVDMMTNDSKEENLWQKWLVTHQELHDRPKYVRGDIVAALRAENERLNKVLAETEERCVGHFNDSLHYQISVQKLEIENGELQEENIKMTRLLDSLVTFMCAEGLMKLDGLTVGESWELAISEAMNCIDY